MPVFFTLGNNNMKKHAILTLLWIIGAGLGCAEGESKELEIRPILGDAFGKIIEIEGKMVNSKDTRMKAHEGRTLISITRVDERQLKQPLVVDVFYFKFTTFKLPERGTLVKFRGYESGRFTGIPNGAFKDIPRVPATNFFFQSHFVVTRSLLPKQEPENDGRLIGPPPVPKDGKLLPVPE